MSGYHRLAREAPGYRWWRLPAAVGVAALGYMTLVSPLRLATGNLTAEPARYAVALLTTALLTPAVLLGVAVAHPAHLRHLVGVAGHVRWGLLGRSFAVSAGCFAASSAVLVWLGPDRSGRDPHVDATALAMAAVTVGLVGFAAAAEEIVFRGLLLQLCGTWLSSPTLALVLPTLAFVFAHDYDWWGRLDVALFGIGAAVVVMWTGGLEAAVAMHTANNLWLLLLQAFGVLSDVSGRGAGSPLGAALTGVTTAALVVIFTRRRLSTPLRN